MDRSAEQELRQLVEERVAAVGAKDPAPLANRQHPELIAFNVVPPLQLRGKAAVAEQTQAWFDAYASDIGYEVRELHLTAEGDVGFCSFLYHVSGTLAAGGEVGARHALLSPHRRPLAHRARPRVRALRPDQR
jgi:ketosteroid isomerase-like protein